MNLVLSDVVGLEKAGLDCLVELSFHGANAVIGHFANPHLRLRDYQGWDGIREGHLIKR